MTGDQSGKLTFSDSDEAAGYLRSIGASAPRVSVRMALGTADDAPVTVWPGNDPHDMGECLGTIQRNASGGIDFIPAQGNG